MRNLLISAFCVSMLGAAGCSVTRDFNECSSDADCASSYGSLHVCAEDGICEKRTIEQMVTDECRLTHGDISADDVLIAGAMLPLTGHLSGVATPIWYSLGLAVDDINENGGINGKQLTLIACDTAGDREQAARGAAHLVDTLGVPAILGPFSANIAFELGPGVAKESQVVMISPSTTSATISTLDDGGFVWRTAPTDRFQGEAVAGLVAQVVSDLPEEEQASAKVSVLYADDLYATDLLAKFNSGISKFWDAGLEDPRLSPPGLYTSASIATKQLEDLAADGGAPDVVVILGSTEVWDIIEDHEEHVSSMYSDEDTIYIIPDLSKDLQRVESVDAKFIGRVWGTQLSSGVTTGYLPYQLFAQRYEAKFYANPERLQFVANAFDSVYALAIAGHNAEFTGEQLSKNLSRISGATAVDATPGGLQLAYNSIDAGQKIALNGASGTFAFDAASGDIDVQRNIVLWCFSGEGFVEKDVIYDGKNYTAGYCGDAPPEDPMMEESE